MNEIFTVCSYFKINVDGKGKCAETEKRINFDFGLGYSARVIYNIFYLTLARLRNTIESLSFNATMAN